MSEMLTLYEAGQTLARAKKEDYIVTAPFTGRQTTLKRNTDFGVIPGTKQPSLFKAGAQKIANAFGLLQHFTVESAIESFDALKTDNGGMPLFFYRVRCDLVKIAQDGTEYVFTTGHGSANTMERRNGRNSAWDSANATLKMAEKRALVAAVLSVSGLSDMFTQDMEAEDFMSQGAKVEDPNEVISAKQLKYLFAVAGANQMTTDEAKAIVSAHGYKSSKDIKKSDYDSILEEIRSKGDQ